MRTSVLLTMVRYSRHGSSGASAPSGFSWKLRPISAGAHRRFDAPHVLEPAHPCTSSMHTSRVLSAAAEVPPIDRRERMAGSIASRYGSAIAAPIPRRNVRRSIAFPIRICIEGFSASS